MVVLAIGSCITVLVFSMILFSRDLSNAKYNKIDVAALVVENEIEELKIKAQIAAFGMAKNPDLIRAIANNDRESIMYISNALRVMAHVDYCTILDFDGIVLTRTHEPDVYNDSLAHLPHVKQAMYGISEAYIAKGVTIRLGTYAGAPIYDDEMNMIGVVSLGFRLDSQDSVHKLKQITGCEITIFLHDERVSTTLIDDEGFYAIGSTASEAISEKVLTGESHVGIVQLYGNSVLAKYVPLYGAYNEIVGMMFVGYDTTEDDYKILFFIIIGAFLTFVVLVVCVIIAMFISRIVERQLKKAQDMIELQLTKLSLMVKSAKIGLWDMEVITDENDPVNPQNVFMWSDDVRQMLGYENEEDFPNVLSSLLDIMHPDDREKTDKAFTGHLLDVTGKTPFDVEYQLLKKNGEYSYFHASGETTRDKDGNAIRIAGALVDISKAKSHLAELENAQENLRQARDTAEAANRSKSIFLANISHEIRTPMNSIIGFSELAQDDDIPPKTKQYLANISDNAKWLLNIINDLLDSTKIESGKIILEHIPFDLHDVITQCQSAVLPKTAEKGIALFCYVEPFNGKKLLGDPVRLRQVFMNLLTNAVKFTNTGNVKLLTSVMDYNDKQATINFEIKDSGIGMSPDQIDIIFEPFMQADDSVTRRFGGTGLGLPITKNIIELMGGTLVVESEFGAGSKFSFTLTFDLIFMDIHMPVMDGLEAASQINGLGVETPILALTANIMSNDLEMYKASGMLDYLGKPFTSQELWKCLIKYLPVENFSPVDKNHQLSEEDKSLKQLRAYFVKNNQTTFTKIMQALDAGDIKLAHRIAHTLKSNAGQIGEKRLQELAAETEAMLADGTNQFNKEKADILAAELNLTLEKYQLAEEANPKNHHEIDDEKIREIIGKLEPLLAKSKPECMKLLDDIRIIPGAEKLKFHAEEFEFKQALEELQKLKKRWEKTNE